MGVSGFEMVWTSATATEKSFINPMKVSTPQASPLGQAVRDPILGFFYFAQVQWHGLKTFKNTKPEGPIPLNTKPYALNIKPCALAIEPHALNIKPYALNIKPYACTEIRIPEPEVI